MQAFFLKRKSLECSETNEYAKIFQKPRKHEKQKKKFRPFWIYWFAHKNLLIRFSLKRTPKGGGGQSLANMTANIIKYFRVRSSAELLSPRPQEQGTAPFIIPYRYYVYKNLTIWNFETFIYCFSNTC